MMKVIKLMATAVILAASYAGAEAQVAGGPPYTLEQTVVAGGGGVSTGGGIFTVEGTTGQPNAGGSSTGSPFNVKSGFFTAAAFSPTAASVGVGGRVTTANGRGISKVRITLSGPDGTVRTVLTAAFGYYRIPDIAAGETYILTVRSKRYQFSNPTLVINVMDELSNVDFTALP